MNSQPLSTSASVVLNGSGAGTASAGPRIGQRWRLTNAAIRVSSNVLEPICKIYIGGNTAEGNFVDGSYSGSQDATDLASSLPLTAGQSIFAVWTGGDVGATATLSLMGVVETGYRS